MTEYERYLVIFTIVGNPVPGEDALYTDDDVVLVRFYCTLQMCRIGIRVFVEDDGSVRIDDTDEHVSCMQIDPGIELMLLVIKSHPASSYGCAGLQGQSFAKEMTNAQIFHY